MLAKEIARASKYVAAIVEGNNLELPCERHARFKIQHRQSIPADWHRERVEQDRVLIPIQEDALRRNCLPWPRFLETKSAQSGRTTREKSFTDGQRAIDLVYRSIPVAVAR